MNGGSFMIGDEKVIYEQNSLNLFTNENNFRILLVKMVHSDLINNLTLVVVIGGSIC